MNFFTVGFALCALKFSMDIPLTYIIKLIGAFFMFGGYKEIEPLFDSFIKYRTRTAAAAAASSGGLVCSLLAAFGILKGTAQNLLSIFFGSAAVVLILFEQYGLIEHMLGIKDLVNDNSLTASLQRTWRKAAFFTMLSLIADICYRLIPDGAVRTAAGTVQVISLLLMYIYIILTASAINRVRNDFNITHPVI